MTKTSRRLMKLSVRRSFSLLLVWAMMGGATRVLEAQTQTQPATKQYERSAFWRALFGENWRAVWSAPTAVPVLDLATYAGGLKAEKAGGNQSSTLHFRGADGLTYIFRSVNKDVEKAMPKDMRKSPVGVIVQDQTSALHPTGVLPTVVLADALGVLRVAPVLYVLPDDARLGEFRKRFAGMLGTLEERPDDKDAKTFAGAPDDIVSSEDMIAALEKSSTSQLDEREYLKARLFDFLIGDTDRGADNWAWAEYKHGDSTLYRAFPRDRDYAFMRAVGPVARVVTTVYPKLTHFRAEYPKLGSLEFMTTDFDRSHLVGLTLSDFDSITADVQHRITDNVIEQAIATLPEPQRALSADIIRSGLKGRRDKLRDVAHALYQMVSESADVFATDDDERADIERNADGSVTVRLFNDQDAAPYFQRTFTPDVTKDIRVYMERGNDRAVVRGNVERSIQVRVTGGEGDDVLIDSSYVAHGDETRLYDASGRNELVAGKRTEISTTPYQMAQPMSSLDPKDAKKPEKHPRAIREERRGRFQDLWVGEMEDVAAKTQAGPTRNWGQKTTLMPSITYRDGPGVIIGVGPTVTNYGFRRKPYEWQAGVRALWGTTSGGFGVQLNADRHFEVSPWDVSLFAQATQLESNRFFGFGNNTPYGRFGPTLVMRDEILVAPRANYAFGKKSKFSFGPVARWTRPHILSNGVADTATTITGSGFSSLGAAADLTVVQPRVGLTAGGSAYPALLDVADPFEEAHAVGKVYVPIGRPTIALRAGGKKVWGDFPLYEAAFIGATESLRGYRWDRYAGDASAFGSAELHLPVGRATLLTRGELGLIAFTDAARVWYKGSSPGGWHTSAGGGLSFATMGQVASLTYAKGEEGRVYFTLGYPF